MKYTIGVDIGGTNTDAVLVDQNESIVSAVKTTTTDDISIGFSEALKQLLRQKNGEVDKIYLGTTQATNAILQKQDLYKVGVIRIAGQRPETLPVGYTWPNSLKEAMIAGEETIGGGLDCDGQSLTPLCKDETACALERLLKKGAESLAIVGVFSPLCNKQEREVAKMAKELLPVSLSSELGGIGFIERENSTILNAALKRVMQKGFFQLQSICQSLGLTPPIMITQNDGSLISMERAIAYPVLTISAGPTNSFIGGARLAKKEDCVVVDIGGTSTDVGLIRKGFPVRSMNTSNIGGVSLNFPMPNVLSVALGGGSVITNPPTIENRSVAKKLSSQAKSFGGDTLTLTDIAYAMGNIDLPNATRRVSLDGSNGEAIFKSVNSRIDDLVGKIRGEKTEFPVFFVGGGSALIQQPLIANFDVANAYGAALAEISGTVDTVVSLKDREKVLSEICEKAKKKAIKEGAKEETLRLVDQQIIPYAYVPNQMARVIIRYSGKPA